MASAHTASVWGNGKAAHLASQHRKLEEGDEECMICRSDERPASVALMPCKHKVCIHCVETMRASNIFKVRPASLCCAVPALRSCRDPVDPLQADKGVKCPFCRGFVEQYDALGRLVSIE